MSDKYIREIGVTPTNGRHLHILNEFINASKAYIISRDAGEGYTFWLVTPDHTARVGLINGKMLPGKTLALLLDSLLATGGNVAMAADTAKLPEEALSIDSWFVKDSPQPEDSDCYRTYMSSGELDKILSFPCQKEYEPYGDVIIVTSTTSLRQGVLLHRVTMPVEIEYTVICPEGVTAEPSVVKKGERLTLIFSKPGFTSQSLTISAGSPSPFMKYVGAAILVNPLQSVGINFTKRIPVSVRAANGKSITGYEITINGRPVNTSRPFIDLTERDLEPGQVIEILVTSTNFEALMVKLPAEKADVNTPLDLVLTPERQGINLRLNFADGTTVEHELYLERTDPRYLALRAGSYCGFRSHLISNPGEPEKYNIEVRAGGKPMPVSIPSQPVAPRPVVEPERKREADEEVQEVSSSRRRPRRRKSYTPVWMICLGIVVAVVIAAVAVLYLPGLYKQYFGTQEATPVLVTEITDTVADELTANSPDNVPGVAETAAVQAMEEGIEERREKAKAEAAAAALSGNADMGYLKDNRVWKRADLTTDDGRKVFDLVGEGNIDAIISSPYFNSGNAAINPTASKIADFLYQAKGTPTQRSNEAALAKLKGKETIDLWELYETLGRLRPATPNPGSRP